MRILSSSLVLFLILTLSRGVGAEQPPKPDFTIETLPADKGPVDARIWSIGDSIRIVETMSLPNTCDRVKGEVNFHDDNTEVFVKLKPESRDLSGEKDCHPNDVPVVVSVTIPRMPFVFGCHHNITLETPQGIKHHDVTIVW
jgi:hypothetical protein